MLRPSDIQPAPQQSVFVFYVFTSIRFGQALAYRILFFPGDQRGAAKRGMKTAGSRPLFASHFVFVFSFRTILPVSVKYAAIRVPYSIFYVVFADGEAR